MPYRFPLERVLQMRLDTKEAAEKKVEFIQNSLNQLRALMQKMLSEYGSQRNELNEKLSSSLTQENILESVLLYDKSLELRKRRLLELLSRIKETESDLDIANISLVQANRNAKVIENLKEKRSSEFEKQIETKERKMLDEMATMRHTRQHKSSQGA
jgi:flagellar export protein FliJ